MVDRHAVTLGEVTVNFDSRRRPVKGMDRVRGIHPYYGASGVVDHVDGYLFDGEFLLVAEDGENLRSRSTPVAFIATGKFWVNNHAHVVRGNERADTRYLSYLLSITDVSGYLTGSTQPKLTRSALDSIRLSVPSVNQQRAIAEVLGALDDKIAANTKVASLSWELADAEYRAVVHGASTSKRLGDVLALEYGKALPAASREPGISAVIGSGGVVGEHSFALVEQSGVIVGRKGTAGAVHWIDGPHWPIDTTFWTRATGAVSQAFAYFLLKGLRLDEMNGDSAVPGLNRNEAHAIPILLPTEGEMERFSNRAENLIALASQASRENRTLAGTRDALLPQLMSGRLRVRDAESLVADAV